jgi:ubiquinol-cytochrome c reductase cytochrome c subunit
MTSHSPADRGAGRGGGLRSRWRRGRNSPPSKLRRRAGAAVRLVAALMLAGGVYTFFAPSVQAQEDVALSTAAQQGKELFNNSCVTCHGRNAQGIEGRGPSLIGVGSASVEFQVETGRMPMARQEAQAERKAPLFNAEDTQKLAAYIQELGGGPQVPSGPLTHDVATDPEALSRGGELFRLNCTSCHGFGGGGGALSSGKYAPSLHGVSEKDIYAAMLSGPQNMPVFGDNQLTPDQKRDVITYITGQLQEGGDPGGFNLGRFGPITEGLAIFLVGITALIFTCLWIAGKS